MINDCPQLFLNSNLPMPALRVALRPHSLCPPTLVSCGKIFVRCISCEYRQCFTHPRFIKFVFTVLPSEQPENRETEQNHRPPVEAHSSCRRPGCGRGRDSARFEKTHSRKSLTFCQESTLALLVAQAGFEDSDLAYLRFIV